MNFSSKLARALALRDAAVTLVRRHGKWETIELSRRWAPGSREMKDFSARVGSLTISYRTPFQRMSAADDALKYRAVQHGLTVPKKLPYGLDVWALKKVLNIEWDDNGNVVLVSLRPGAWEAELITLANSEAV